MSLMGLLGLIEKARSADVKNIEGIKEQVQEAILSLVKNNTAHVGSKSQKPWAPTKAWDEQGHAARKLYIWDREQQLRLPQLKTARSRSPTWSLRVRTIMTG
jgi:hypothetical protein